jgi:hypothetical protein
MAGVGKPSVTLLEDCGSCAFIYSIDNANAIPDISQNTVKHLNFLEDFGKFTFFPCGGTLSYSSTTNLATD